MGPFEHYQTSLPDGYYKKNDLRKTKANIASIAKAKLKLNELYNRVLINLQQGSTVIKVIALGALDTKVYAKGIDTVEIKGVIPLELALPTIAQTSA
ncbi:MAG: hypothetical protein PHE50_04635 [Dehalococcoidales bacterium]|nr:hypothetical protein [Dehalococcoidales bacterium]